MVALKVLTGRHLTSKGGLERAVSTSLSTESNTLTCEQHDSASHVNYDMLSLPIILKHFPIILMILDHTYYSKSNASIFGQWLVVCAVWCGWWACG